MGRETIRSRGGVVYRELQSRSLLNRCVSTRMPFQWTVNPYRGCAMGCRYCYAAYTHEFMGIATPEEFHTTVFVKRGAEPETARRLSAVVRRGELIALGTATDPYQPGEAEERITRGFLEAVAARRGVRLGITTKGAIILRDLDLLRRINLRSTLSVHVSLISSRPELLRELEPWAPPPEVRIEVMRRLAEAQIPIALSLAPVLPAITDDESDLDELLGRVAAAGVTKMSWNILFLRSPTREKYLRWVAARFPRLHDAYQRAYAGRVYLGGAYRERLKILLERLRARHGLAPAFSADRAEQGSRPEQMRLWA